MPTAFDVEKALQAQIQGLSQIRATLQKRERATEQVYSEMEIELEMLRRLRGYADIELERHRNALRKLNEG